MRRRYKLLLIIFISFLLVLIIYFFIRKEEFIYVSLGDDLSFNNISTYNYIEYLEYYYAKEEIKVYKFVEEYNPSENLYKQILENVGNINYFLKNADIITLSLGTIELNNYKELNEEVIVKYLNNVYILIKKISKLNENVFIINMYSDKYQFINKKISEYCKENNIFYLSIDDIYNKYIYQNNLKTYLNYKGHQQIANYIVNKLDKTK